jgi:hypothetical protein
VFPSKHLSEKQIYQNLVVINNYDGYIKIKVDILPMMMPTIKQIPENKPRCLLSVTLLVGNTAPNASG